MTRGLSFSGAMTVDFSTGGNDSAIGAIDPFPVSTRGGEGDGGRATSTESGAAAFSTGTGLDSRSSTHLGKTTNTPAATAAKVKKAVTVNHQYGWREGDSVSRNAAEGGNASGSVGRTSATLGGGDRRISLLTTWGATVPSSTSRATISSRASRTAIMSAGRSSTAGAIIDCSNDRRGSGRVGEDPRISVSSTPRPKTSSAGLAGSPAICWGLA